MGYQISKCLNIGQLSVLKYDVPYCLTYISAPLSFTERGGQTWKNLQAVQAALADILSEITFFLGHFEPNIPFFLLNKGKEELKM